MHSLKLGILVTLLTFVQSELYTSVFELTELVDVQEKVLYNLLEYMKAEEERLRNIKSYIMELISEHKEAVVDKQKYVGNPIRAFRLIKRLTLDLDRIISLALQASDFNWKPEESHPTDEDVNGAALSIARLQKFYKLNVSMLAQGNLTAAYGNGVTTEEHSPMSSSDCFALGTILYKEKLFEFAAKWFEEALHLYTDEDHLPYTADEVMKHIIRSYHNANIKSDSNALEWAKRLFFIDEENEVESDMILEFYRKLAAKDALEHLIEDGEVPEDISTLSDTYSKLCRGETEISPGVTSRLHCSYLKRNAFLRLAPIKAEQIYDDPEVFLFHDVMSDEEIEIIKGHAKNELERALVVKNSTVKPTLSRIGKSAWLSEDNEKADVKMIKLRTADFTGFNMDGAEALQALNYGIGGQYDLHYDAAFDAPGVPKKLNLQLKRAKVKLFNISRPTTGRIGKSAWIDDKNGADDVRFVKLRTADFTGLNMNGRASEPLQALNYGIGGQYDLHYDASHIDGDTSFGEFGNRIATVLFYMSEVPLGGATVFPKLGLSVRPQKGTALYWKNLLSSGRHDSRMLHAACAVLSGSKWVANYWIHEKTQELQWPCPLTEEIDIQGDKLYPLTLQR